MSELTLLCGEFMTPSAVEVTIIVVSYNTRDLTIACLESIFAETMGIVFEVVVFDNASVDGSVDAISQYFPKVRLIKSERNLGFALANNAAVEGASGEFILLLNSDTLVLDGAIQKMVASARQLEGEGILGGQTCNADGSINPSSTWVKPTLWSVFCQSVGLSALFRGSRVFNPEVYPTRLSKANHAVDIVSGCFCMLPRTTWNRLGGFDPNFFMYGEDADLCLRANRLGIQRIMLSAPKIIHFGGSSERNKAEKMVKLFRAKAQLFEKHWPKSSAIAGVFLLDTWALIRMVAFGALTLLRRRQAKARLDEWKSVWMQRATWRVGTENNQGRKLREQANSRPSRGSAPVKI